MTRIKICGIRRIEDIEILNKYKPDYIGFVFAKSKRQVEASLAFELKVNLDKSIKAVGVFVNNKTDEIINLIEKGIIDAVQFHGDETEKDIENIKNLFPNITVFKAISVTAPMDILKWENSKADFLLLDNGKGGTGKQWSWQILNQIDKMKKDFFVAGGLCPENVKEVLKFRPFGVDVSGGVESDSVKDENKIKEFIKSVREDYEKR